MRGDRAAVPSVVEWVVHTGALRAGFTSRLGGVSEPPYASLNLGPHVGDNEAAVAANRRILEREVRGVAWMTQVHGSTVCPAVEGEAPEADALIVAPGTARAAAVMVADCVPLLLLDAEVPLGAAVHVGRAGLLAGISAHAAAALRARGARNITAVIGPCICGSHYEVPVAMRARADAVAPGCAAESVWGTPSIDIPAGIRGQLAANGIEDVRNLARCTYEDRAYFSHRRGAPTGRFAGVVELVGDTPR